MKKIILLITILAGLFFLNSCKTDNAPDDPNEPNKAYAPVNVLRDNSAYEHIWDTTILPRAGFAAFGVKDMTVDSKNQMHFVFGEESEFPTRFRRTWDLVNKKMIPQNPKAAKESEIGGLNYLGREYTTNFTLYKPYTNYYVAGYMTVLMSGEYYPKVYFQGDVGYDNAMTFYQFGMLELGFENVVGHDAQNKAYMFIGLNKKDNEDFNYAYKNTRVEIANPASMYYALCEARTTGKSLYIGYDKTSLKAYEFDRDVEKEVTTGTLTASVDWNPYVVWMKTHVEYPEKKFTKAIRHYSADGSIMSFAFMNFNTYKFTSFVYNFTTKEFKKVVDDMELSYGKIGSSDNLMDLDDEGNIYYAGYANNGKNDVGISVYKLSAGNKTTLVGNDDFLKFGRVAKLKYLHGKIYLCVTGVKTGTSVHQVSFLRTK